MQLCFGLSTAPRIFIKILKPLLAELRAQGMRLVAYLVDSWICYSSEEMCRHLGSFSKETARES